MTSSTLTAPSGPTATPKTITIQGMERQRRRPPIVPVTASQQVAGRAQGGVGHRQ